MVDYYNIRQNKSYQKLFELIFTYDINEPEYIEYGEHHTYISTRSFDRFFRHKACPS